MIPIWRRLAWLVAVTCATGSVLVGSPRARGEGTPTNPAEATPRPVATSSGACPVDGRNPLTSPPSPLPQPTGIVISQLDGTDDAISTRWTVGYLVLQVGDAGVQQTVNAALLAMAQSEVAEAKRVGALLKRTPGSGTNEPTLDYSVVPCVTLLTDGLMSVRLDLTQTGAGIASSGHVVTTTVFDLTNGQAVSPDDVFAPGFQSGLAQLLLGKIKGLPHRSFPSDADLYNAILGELQRSAVNFLLAADGTVHYFDFPFASRSAISLGNVDERVTADELTSLLRQPNPLGNWVRPPTSPKPAPTQVLVAAGITTCFPAPDLSCNGSGGPEELARYVACTMRNASNGTACVPIDNTVPLPSDVQWVSYVTNITNSNQPAWSQPYTAADTCTGVDGVEANINRALDANPHSQFVLVGHSLGGFAMAKWAADNPTRLGRINKIITLDSPLRVQAPAFPLDVIWQCSRRPLPSLQTLPPPPYVGNGGPDNPPANPNWNSSNYPFWNLCGTGIASNSSDPTFVVANSPTIDSRCTTLFQLTNSAIHDAISTVPQRVPFASFDCTSGIHPSGNPPCVGSAAAWESAAQPVCASFSNTPLAAAATGCLAVILLTKVETDLPGRWRHQTFQNEDAYGHFFYRDPAVQTPFTDTLQTTLDDFGGSNGGCPSGYSVSAADDLTLKAGCATGATLSTPLFLIPLLLSSPAALSMIYTGDMSAGTVSATVLVSASDGSQQTFGLPDGIPGQSNCLPSKYQQPDIGAFLPRNICRQELGVFPAGVTGVEVDTRCAAGVVFTVCGPNNSFVLDGLELTPAAAASPCSITCNPVSGSITGTVYATSVGSGNALAGVSVEACHAAPCVTTLTNASGQFTLTNLPQGLYNVTALPGPDTGLLPGTIGPISLPTNTTLTGEDIVLTGPNPPPVGTTITSIGTGGGGAPKVDWSAPATLTTQGCLDGYGGIATYTISQGSVTLQSGSMPEGPPGTFTATVPALSPAQGYANVSITIQCVSLGTNGPPNTFVSFYIYVDPSGLVETVEGVPITGATVTLLRSDAPSGPYVAVPDGSGTMSLVNRHNPDTTDAAGRFGWDVIPGFYKVRAEKAGCASPTDPSQHFVQSGVLPIPPAATNEDLRLECLPNAGATTNGAFRAISQHARLAMAIAAAAALGGGMLLVAHRKQ
jgi:pimeloyl-ACP methyl ester carboxylesterase